MADLIKVTVNKKEVEVRSGLTILELARLQQIEIPTFCHDDRLKPTGDCRMCVVEVQGVNNLVAACATKVEEGMIIETESEEVIKARKGILELIWTNHPNDCFNCDKSGDCKLQDYSYQYNVGQNPLLQFNDTNKTVLENNKFYYLDYEKCINCGKCIRICDELQAVNAIEYVNRGSDTKIDIMIDEKPIDGVINKNTCVSCGNCVSNCPVGALMPKSKRRFRIWNKEKITTTCPYCGVGCQIELVVKDNKIIDVNAVKDTPNDGLLCVKGKFGMNFINHPDRLKRPLIKEDGKFIETSWDEAYKVITNKINEVKHNYGSSAFAGLASAKCTNEENYLMQKFVRTVFGNNNIDHCARLCHASTVAGLASTLGSGAMTNSISEISQTDTFLVVGSNTTETHPVIGSRIKQAVKEGSKLIVADPRKIELAQYADVFLQIKPGTNVALVNGLLNVIYNEGLIDQEFINEKTEGFENLVKIIKDYTPDKVAQICGVDANDIIKAAKLYASANKAAIYYAMGVTQHSNGTNHVKAFANLALITGNLGKEGTGVNPLRGQNNVQGACDVGGLPNVYPSYQSVSDLNIKAKFEKAWNVKLSDIPGHTLPIMMNNANDQDIRFMYIMGENPVVSDPDTNHIKKALSNLDFLVVQDIFMTETAKFADVVLPAATFAEKDGTFTNTDRHVQRIRKAVDSPGEAKPDWEILSELLARTSNTKRYENVEEIFNELLSLSPIYGGITYSRLENTKIQWPCPTENHPGTKYLYQDGFAKIGKAKFTETVYIGPKELPDDEYPLILTTGRVLYHFHSKSMTDRVVGLKETVADNFIQISPITAKIYQLKHDEYVYVNSRRGSSKAKVQITNTIDDGVVFMPFHFADGANMLTNPVLDEICNIPELKVAAVNIEKIRV